MNNYEFTYKGETFNRISKAKARKEFLKGNGIVIAACNIRPFNNWYYGYDTISIKSSYGVDEIGHTNYFTTMINSFEYYNCINSETGKYAAFYISEK